MQAVHGNFKMKVSVSAQEEPRASRDRQNGKCYRHHRLQKREARSIFQRRGSPGRSPGEPVPAAAVSRRSLWGSGRGSPSPAATGNPPPNHSSTAGKGQAAQPAETKRGSRRPHRAAAPARTRALHTPRPKRRSPTAPRPEHKQRRRAPGRGTGKAPAAADPHPRGGRPAVLTLARPLAATRCCELGAGKACGGTFSILPARAATCGRAGGALRHRAQARRRAGPRAGRGSGALEASKHRPKRREDVDRNRLGLGVPVDISGPRGHPAERCRAAPGQRVRPLVSPSGVCLPLQ